MQSIDQSTSVRFETKVLGIVQETADTRSFLLDLPAACSAYQAGQHVSISVLCGESVCTRSYSFSSAPEVDAIPTLTVRRVPGGKVSTWLHEQIAIGSVIQARPPSGHFTLSAEDRAPLLLLGAGSGITPLMSLAKAALVRTRRPVRLFYANSSVASTIFKRQLDALARRHSDQLTLSYHLDELQGFPKEENLARQFLGFAPSDIYVCGPPPFMQLASQTTSRYAPHASLHVEHFAAAERVSPAARQVESVDACVRWKIAGTTVTFRSRPEQTLLEAARDAGHDPPASCEEGYCGSCAVRLVGGRVTMRSSDGLSATKRASGWVLPCQARALTSEIKLEP